MADLPDQLVSQENNNNLETEESEKEDVKENNNLENNNNLVKFDIEKNMGVLAAHGKGVQLTAAVKGEVCA